MTPSVGSTLASPIIHAPHSTPTTDSSLPSTLGIPPLGTALNSSAPASLAAKNDSTSQSSSCAPGTKTKKNLLTEFHEATQMDQEQARDEAGFQHAQKMARIELHRQKMDHKYELQTLELQVRLAELQQQSTSKYTPMSSPAPNTPTPFPHENNELGLDFAKNNINIDLFGGMYDRLVTFSVVIVDKIHSIHSTNTVH